MFARELHSSLELYAVSLVGAVGVQSYTSVLSMKKNVWGQGETARSGHPPALFELYYPILNGPFQPEREVGPISEVILPKTGW